MVAYEEEYEHIKKLQATPHHTTIYSYPTQYNVNNIVKRIAPKILTSLLYSTADSMTMALLSLAIMGHGAALYH